MAARLFLLTLCAGALAARHGGHRHHHERVAVAYGTGNATGPFNSTGTGSVSSKSHPTTVLTETDYHGNTAPAPPPSSHATSAVSAPAPYAPAGSSAGGESHTVCTTDVTVTTTEKVTVTVTRSKGPSSSKHHSTSTSTIHTTTTVTVTDSSSASAVSSGSSPSSASISSYSLSSAPVSSSESSAPATSSSKASVSPASSYGASSSMSSSAVPTDYHGADRGHYTAVPSQATATSSVAKSGKRGVAYNDVKLVDILSSSPHVSWAYNWASSCAGLSKNLNFIPTLWGTAEEFVSVWKENAQSAIDNGSKYLFSFNEPDNSAQANMSPGEAAAAYKQYMMPFAGKGVKLCAPSITNAGGNMGLNWLTSFIEACDGCQIDCLNLHWYDSHDKTDYFKSHIQNATDIAGGKPVWVTEFGCTDGTPADISSFLQDVMPWMDKEDKVEGYAYFMASEGLLVSGSGPSEFGNTYVSFSE